LPEKARNWFLSFNESVASSSSLEEKASMRRSKQCESQICRLLEVVDFLRAFIADSSLRPGDRVPSEQELMRTLKIGRSSLRAGLACLDAIGEIEVRPGAGIFLSDGPRELPFSVARATHSSQLGLVHEALSIVEGHLAELAAERASHEDHTALAEEVAEMYAATERPPDYLSHIVQFHLRIGMASGNPILAALAKSLIFVLHPEIQKTVQKTSDLRESARSYREIYKAIRRRQAAEARMAMEHHLRLLEDEPMAVAKSDAHLTLRH
jgi:GntR family transcriptional regulator, transcriptional repressor for pyruvate dehydrogenase complex